MFWRFGGYANISTIDTILDKPDVSLEEVLDESDLIQELKQHNSKLIEYLRDENVLRRLMEYVVSPVEEVAEDESEWEDEEDDEEEDERQKKSMSPLRSLSLGRNKEDKSEKQQEEDQRDTREKTRQKYAYVASEVLSSETWSIVESLMDHQADLKKFWGFIRRDAPLDPVTAGYFTKINETLLDKKTEETLNFVKSLDGIIPAMLRHVDCPMVMDLLLKIISMEKAEGGQGVVDWLHAQNLIPALLAFLGDEHPTFTQTSAGDFIKAIITISANASQNEQSCIGPNSLTRQLVSESCIEGMIKDMLKGGNPLTVGVGIIIEVIRKNNSDYDPEITMGNELPPTTSDPIYLGTLLRLFAKHVPDFTNLILSPNHTVTKGDDKTVTEKRKDLEVAFGNAIEPLGFDRFKTCELMAELLHCSNMGLLNERGSEDYIYKRDQERERLRAEGALSKTTEPQSAVTEFSDGSSFLAGERSPTETRKLEVTNSADEDGFEDVGASADIKELKSGEPIRKSTPRLSLDDEFVDEPLTSPKPDQSPNSPQEERKAEPESPTTAISAGVKDVQITEEVRTESSTAPSTTDDLVNEIEAQLSPSKTTADAPPLPKRDGLTSSNGPEQATASEDDRPAPLFASRPDEQPPTQEQPQGGTASTEVTQEATHDMPFIHRIENDVDGKPIVGDYLKMQFVEHKVVPTILDFFFRFPWNNFLHNVVYDVVQQVFNGPMDRGYNRNLAFDLFMTGRITERIIEGQAKSDEVTARSSMRLGYMGHLTLVAEEVVKFSERHPPEVLSEPVLDFLTSKAWCDYVENTLSETRDRDNAILGGVRPDMAVGPRQAVLNAVNAASGFGNTGSNALANAGLNGGAGLDSMELTNNGQSNFLNSGSLLSGFGSSSDEEDEEMEEINEHDEAGAEGSGSDQYSQTHHPAYTPSSLSALSLFSKSPDSLPPSAHPDAPDSTDTTLSTDNTNTSTPSSTPISTPSLAVPSDTTPSEPPSLPAPLNPHAAPPAPLNIAPSRARRQLQARLALSKEKAEKAEREARTGTSPTSPNPATSTSPNPATPTSSTSPTVSHTTTTTTSSGPSHSNPESTSPTSPSTTESPTQTLDRLLRAAKSGPEELAVSEALRRADEDGKRRAALQGKGKDKGTEGNPWMVRGLGTSESASGDGVFADVDSADVDSADEDEDDDEEGDGGGDEGQGESVPLRMSSSPRTMGFEAGEKAGVKEEKTGAKTTGSQAEIPAQPSGVVNRMRSLFSSGSGSVASRDSEDGSGDDTEGTDEDGEESAGKSAGSGMKGAGKSTATSKGGGIKWWEGK